MDPGISLNEFNLNNAIKNYNEKIMNKPLILFIVYLTHLVKYEDTWNIYSELAKAYKIKLDTLKQMSNYYNEGYVKKDERIQLATRALLVPNLSSPPEGSTLAAIPTTQLRELSI
ncbi:hypothetical protein C2G38_2254709 [Gigaspora rosea]|uniref:Uncharacterized protein n=1 Tax=Gigaspora rosea TaxID=44941 RepID=A0A397U0Y5_9GLOM|nr:hypothetical protein C2G38_2254709 [Gigaspora rosea]